MECRCCQANRVRDAAELPVTHVVPEPCSLGSDADLLAIEVEVHSVGPCVATTKCHFPSLYDPGDWIVTVWPVQTPNSICPLGVIQTPRSCAPLCPVAASPYVASRPPSLVVVLNQRASEYTLGAACGCVLTIGPPEIFTPVPDDDFDRARRAECDAGRARVAAVAVARLISGGRRASRVAEWPVDRRSVAHDGLAIRIGTRRSAAS